MSHSWSSPARAAREELRETLKSLFDDLGDRNAAIELCVEELERQFAEPDDEMVIDGLAAFEAAGGRMPEGASYFRRRAIIEAMWDAMVLRGFDR